MLILLVIFVFTSIAFLIILRIDLFVHADLYEYGLQFTTLWANDYWYNKNMLLVFLVGSSTLSALLMIPHFDHSKKPTLSSRWTGILLPIISVIYLFLNNFLHSDR
ncbi:MAG: hypothetical protein NWF10_03290 [Candidatus Bathyarchaeota archaeon]|nr:hypothetical protein [Candidatus Bathyarchaeota archaeon]